MAWPPPTDFSDAVQNPQHCFEAQDLAQGATAVNNKGIPMSWSGNFACVFKVETPGGDVAVRCFTKQVNDQQDRYGHLSAFLKIVKPDFLVGFEYVERGIKVKGEWYPIVRMDWVEGDPLDRFVKDHIGTPDIFMELADRWLEVNHTLRILGIAHNDLQHGNVMVQEQGALRLVDYDGVFLPKFNGEPSPETGHKHYQHPKRTSQDYHSGIDNFPSLVVYLTLLSLKADPQLWGRFYIGDNMLFTKDDFANPANSDCFRALKGSSDGNVAGLAAVLEEFCSRAVDQVPPLEEVLRGNLTAPMPSPPSSNAPAPSAPSNSPAPAPTGSSYRDLLQSGQAAAPPPLPVPAPPATNPAVTCPSCKRTNSTELIYCADENCATVLLPGRKTCNSCNSSSIPLNAYYCPGCGVNLVALTST